MWLWGSISSIAIWGDYDVWLRCSFLFCCFFLLFILFRCWCLFIYSLMHLSFGRLCFAVFWSSLSIYLCVCFFVVVDCLISLSLCLSVHVVVQTCVPSSDACYARLFGSLSVVFSSSNLADPRSGPALPVDGNPSHSLHAVGNLEANIKSPLYQME